MMFAWWEVARITLAVPFWWLALTIMGRHNSQELFRQLSRR